MPEDDHDQDVVVVVVGVVVGNSRNSLPRLAHVNDRSIQ